MNTVIYSLTEPGRALAKRLLALLKNAEHKHKPESFVETVQRDFSEGKRGVFICATGIVIRALAPILTDKTSDPAIIVIDEKGEYVIPLLSGHEGGSGQLAQIIATAIDAHCVYTSSTNYGNPIYVLGMGCDRGCPLRELQDLIELSTTQIRQFTDSANFRFEALASIDIKTNEKGLIALGDSLSIPYKTYSPQQLRTIEDKLSYKSDIVFNEVGCYGVAEAAALLAATEITGVDSELVITKQKNKRATLAVARSYIQ